MKVALNRVSRYPKWPREAVLAASIWLAMMACAAGWNHYTHQDRSFCPLRRWTGVPCVACGTTRATLALVHGDVVAAIRWNPLGTTVVALFVLHLALRVVAGRAVRIELSPREWRIALGCGVALLLANWVYVFFRLGWTNPGI